MKTAIPTPSVAASEISLYRSVLEIKKEHDLEELYSPIGMKGWYHEIGFERVDQ